MVSGSWGLDWSVARWIRSESRAPVWQSRCAGRDGGGEEEGCDGGEEFGGEGGREGGGSPGGRRGSGARFARGSAAGSAMEDGAARLSARSSTSILSPGGSSDSSGCSGLEDRGCCSCNGCVGGDGGSVIANGDGVVALDHHWMTLRKLGEFGVCG